MENNVIVKIGDKTLTGKTNFNPELHGYQPESTVDKSNPPRELKKNEVRMTIKNLTTGEIKSFIKFCKPQKIQPKKFELGQWILTDHKLERVEALDHKNKLAVRNWIPVDHKMRVMIIGQRTLYNGELHRDYNEDDSYVNLFVPKCHFRALLVVANINEKPFYILRP